MTVKRGEVECYEYEENELVKLWLLLMQVYMVLRVKQVERVRIAANSAAIRPGGEALTLGLSSSARDNIRKVVAHVSGRQ